MKSFISLMFVITCLTVTYGQQVPVSETSSDSLIVNTTITDTLVDNSISSDSLTDTTDNALTSHPKLGLVQRTHDYKKQVWLAAGMMVFMALVISSAQTWNPR